MNRRAAEHPDDWEEREEATLDVDEPGDRLPARHRLTHLWGDLHQVHDQ